MVRANYSNPPTHGALCTKVSRYAERTYHPSRVLTPLKRVGKKGEGRWITLYIRNGHVFMTVAGLRLDTGGRGSSEGPLWKPETRQGKGHFMRHPRGY